MKTNLTKEEAYSKIIGNEYLKRAITVSLTGKYPITVIGHPDNGREYLEIVLGNLLTFKKPCLCGNLGSFVRSCSCTPEYLEKYKNSGSYRIALENDITVKLEDSTPADYRKTSDILSDYNFNIEIPTTYFEIEKNAISLLETAIQRRGFTAKQVEQVKKISKTIAIMDSLEIIKAYHISEAIGYKLINDIY